ncbi:MAG: type I secretion system permease/ATPase [Brucella intermedia]
MRSANHGALSPDNVSALSAGQAPEVDAVKAFLSRERSVDILNAGEDPLLDGLLLLCDLYERSASGPQLTAGLPLSADGKLTLDLMERAGSRADLAISVRSGQNIQKIPGGLLPVLLVMQDHSVIVLSACQRNECTILVPQMPAKPLTISLEDLQAEHSGTVVFCAPTPRFDERAEAFGAQKEKHWFWSEVRQYKWSFVEIAGAAALTNILAICSSLFSRQVFDRVVPNQAFSTLWVLVIGVLIAIGMEAIIRITRAYLIDMTGKKLDLGLSSRIFEQAMAMKLAERPRSTGSFVNQVRECDSVREFFTSTTIAAVSDIPFVFLFIAIIWLIAGPMAYVQILAIPLIVIPGLLAQPALAKASRRHLRESSIRNGLLIEAMTGAETVKVLAAESRFQRLWEEYAVLLASNSTAMRAITNTLSYLASSVQQIAYVMLMVVGVYLIADGQLTSGGLLACSILSSRAISPLTQLAGIFGRWQQMQAALVGLEGIIKAPVDRPHGRKFVHRPRLQGEYSLEDAQFRYEKEGDPALRIASLSLASGSATALLGTNGSGKSTLLKVLAGLYDPAEGRLLLDGTDMRQVDPVDVRRQLAYLPQDVRLFYGSLRDNLLLGVGHRSDEELLQSLEFVGAEGLVRNHAQGLDRAIGEGGSGVSGGQRQSIGLARVWLRDPRIVLLDEPTAAMDHALELKVINNMKTWLNGRTFVVATHRQPVLQLVDEAVIMNRGKIAASGPLDGVLAGLSSNRDKPGAQGDAS